MKGRSIFFLGTLVALFLIYPSGIQATPSALAIQETQTRYASPESVYTNAKSMIKVGYRYWSIDDMLKARQYIERHLSAQDDYLLRYYMGLSAYRIGLFYLRDQRKKDEAKQFIDEAIDHIE